MTHPPTRKIRAASQPDIQVELPPSKSYTNRALVAAALAEGTSRLSNPSESEDSALMLQALAEFTVHIRRSEGSLTVEGTGGSLRAPGRELFLGNAGTAMRFLVCVAGLAEGETVLTGNEQMKRRPIGDLLASLTQAGIRSSCRDGFPPVKIQGGTFQGDRIRLAGGVSSQFVSSILLCAPYAKRSVLLEVHGTIPSLPYVDMTLHVMRSFGAQVAARGTSVYSVENTQHYIGHEFPIEPDATSASYFLASAALTAGRVTIPGLPPASLQGDIKFLKILAEMGCTVSHHAGGIELRGTGTLTGVEVDMNGIPDCVPTLAVLAAFATGPTVIRNISQLRYKETDRIEALARELAKIGATVEPGAGELRIQPGRLRPAVIETYNDHRIAMSFAMAGLRVKGIEIVNPGCVSKSFPRFWDEFQKLESKE